MLVDNSTIVTYTEGIMLILATVAAAASAFCFVLAALDA